MRTMRLIFSYAILAAIFTCLPAFAAQDQSTQSGQPQPAPAAQQPDQTAPAPTVQPDQTAPAPAAPAASQSTTTAAPQSTASQPPNAPQPAKIKLTDYSKSRSQFPNPLSVYIPRHVPEAYFGNSPRIDQLVKDGKIMLSMDDAIALSLENNLDLAIARYNLSIADTDILVANAGQATRGVATGVVQGTPGGGVGGFGTGAQGAGAGGTTAGAGGAGAGSSGLVQSSLGAGPAVESFDPFLSSQLSLERATSPLSNTVQTGVANFNQNTATADFAYNQGFVTGTSFSLGFDNNRQISNSLRSALQPTINSSFRATLTQHLLQGLGILPQRRFILIAKNDRRISDAAFRQQVATTIPQIENIYWDLVNAYANVQVQERSVQLAQKTLSDTEKQVQIGTLAPIQVTQARSVLATDQQTLIVAQTNLQLQQSLMKNAILRTIPAGSPIVDAPVIPTDTMEVPADENLPPIQQMIDQALKDRPEIEQSLIDLKNRDITQKAARNELLPSVDLFAFYGASGLAGDQNAAATCAANPCTSAEIAQGKFLVPGSIPSGGIESSIGHLFNSSAPDKGVGLNVIIPLRNRAAQADSVRSQLEYRQAELRLEQLKNQIGIDVRNAQFALEQNRALVKAAQDGQQFAQENLDAEQKKYALGASTVTLVLQAQRDLAQAQSQLVSAQTAYEKSRVELDRVTGQTLAENNIHLDESEAGVVATPPHAPHVIPAPPQSQQSPAMQPPAAQPQAEQPQTEQQPQVPQESSQPQR